MSEADDCTKTIAALQQQSFDCVFLDYRLPDGDGLSLVQQVRSLGIMVPLIVLTGQGDEQIAVQVLKAGACDYISKAKVTQTTYPKCCAKHFASTEQKWKQQQPTRS